MLSSIIAHARRRLPKRILWRVFPVRAAYTGGDLPDANFGDQLTPFLLQRLYGLKVLNEGFGRCEVAAVGSVFERLRIAGHRPVIWGTGFIQEGPPFEGRALNVVAVRGELTRSRLGAASSKSSIPLGDPGLLAAEALPHLVGTDKKFKIGVIPHYSDANSPVVANVSRGNGIHVIDVCDSPENVLRQIAECEVVFSSSLHGLVVAESFGVPNFWTPVGAGLEGGAYKFNDYYSAFGLKAEPNDLTVSVANADELVRQWKPLPGLKRLKRELLQSFPWPVAPGVRVVHPTS